MSTPANLLNGGNMPVPATVALCPECGSSLHVHSNEWDTETGVPTPEGLQIDCVAECEAIGQTFYDVSHRWFQSDWQPVVDEVREWASVSERGRA